MEVEVIRPLKKLWENRPKSNLIQFMMKQSGVDRNRLTRYFGKRVDLFNNKLNRNTFTFEEIVTAAYACGFNIAFIKDEKIWLISRKDYMSPYAIDMAKKIFKEDLEDLEEKRKRYLALKAEMEKLEKEI